MINILITSAGQRVSLVRAFKKEVTKYGKSNKVYTIDNNPTLAPACHISDGYKKVPKINDVNYLDSLLKICAEWDINLVIPTIDTELLFLAEHKKLFQEKNIIIVVSDSSLVKKCRDKRLLHSFFEQNSIQVPKKISKEKPIFPIFIKPYDGSSSKETYLIKSLEDLTENHIRNPKLMFMEYIDSLTYDEYTVDTYYNKENYVSCIVPRKRIFVRAGEINKGVTKKNELVPFIKTHLNRITGAIGCITMQFFLHKSTKQILGIEINPRFGGGYPLSYMAGANYPKFIIDEYYFNKEITYCESWEADLLMLRYDDEILVHDYNE